LKARRFTNRTALVLPAAALLGAGVLITAVPLGAAKPPQHHALSCFNKKVTIGGSHNGGVTVGTPHSDVIATHRGNDIVRARGGNDYICTGRGNDVVRADGGNDAVKASVGNDTVYGQGGSDVLRGEKSADVLRGGGGPDHLKGGPGNDKEYGGTGHDVCKGGVGSDENFDCEEVIGID
jgi:Ca2+-binding RTX toxin-like protein